LLASSLLCSNLVAQDSPSDQLVDAIIAEYWEYQLQESPTLATRAGVSEFNDRLSSVTPADQQRRRQNAESYRRRIRDIDASTLSEANQVNAELFEWVLDQSIGAYELNLSRIPFNTFSGFYTSVLSMANGVPMNTTKDYEDYISRLNDIPRYFSEHLANMREGIRSGFTLPKIVIDNVLPTIEAQLYDDPTQSRLYQPFLNVNPRLPEAEQLRLQQQAQKAIEENSLPAFAELAEFLDGEYRTAATDSLGAEQITDGSDYYAYQIENYTTIETTSADEIHATGLAEVARIRREMDGVITDLDFEGSFEDFTHFLRTDPQFYAQSEEELLKEAAFIAKRIDYEMPKFFGKLPRLSYGIVPVPAELAPSYTTAAYVGAPIGGTQGGAYWVNTYALDQRPLYELPALTLHEAVPGHHHQIALAQELEDVPDFRLNQYFTAFGEGWGLYAEKLGIEMGIYQTPYQHFGRLSFEMWRACRLVIDTGIHSQGWSRDQAIAYLTDNTSLSETNVVAEVDRYISWPGQALGYKLGELKIWELRRRAERVLGDDFDIREFHDVLLSNGALPLAMLEAQIDRYLGLDENSLPF